MANIVIIRIHPADPSLATDFTAALAGLTISIFDRSYGNPTSGTQIGSASFDTPGPNKGVIVQHFLPIAPFSPLSVATAAIVIKLPGAYKEYQTADLLLKITRGGTPISDASLNYNVGEVLGFALPLPPVPAGGDPPATAAAKATPYMLLAPVSLYWAMPTFDTDPSKAHLQVPPDGTPPNFDDLRAAVEKVLASDPTGTVDLTKLSIEQCANVAYEIVWNRTLLPLPAPPSGDSLEGMYTKPNSDGDKPTEHRQQFEANLAKYYTSNDGQADTLTKYVFALSAALACQTESVNATKVGFTFPILLTGTPAPGKVAEATVALGAPLGFNVPAPYFYALAAMLPPDVGVDLRYRTATVADEKQLFNTLTKAFNAGVISNNSKVVSTSAPMGPTVGPSISFEQAARRLHALGAGNGVTPVIAPGVATTLVGHWLAYASNDTGDPDGDLAGFWAGTPTPLTATDKSDQRDLVICAIAKIAKPDAAPDNVVSAVTAAGFPIATTDDLKAITTDQWTTIFTATPNLLVDVTGPGSVPQRVARWVRLLTRFFDVTASTALSPTVTLGLPPQLDQSINDPVLNFLNAFTAGFTFGGPTRLDPNDPAFQTALQAVFGNDPVAHAWLTELLLAIDVLYFVTDVVGADAATHFSLTEALYARGFTTLDSITVLSPSDFGDALIGTIAYVYAAAIQTKAGGSHAPPVPPPGNFHPINPGTLTNCQPPPELSPFGPVAYLAALLRILTGDECDDSLPGPDPNSPYVTLGTLVATRRGSLGDLDVTRANLETALPVVDLVNECLEEMVADASTTGAVYNASPTATEKLLAALPEHSSPATPVAKPHAYEILENDFTSCCLPYNQPLDVDRSYLGALHTTRYSVMHHFRKEISEFVLDPTHEPATFPSYRWRYPVRIDIAREYLHVSPEEYDHLYTHDLSTTDVMALYGFLPSQSNWLTVVLTVSEFLTRTCLSYCEFLELWRSRFVIFGRALGGERQDGGEFPDCPPCYLDQEHIVFPPGTNKIEALKHLAIFIRLWRTLQGVPNAKYSFATLRDICIVLHLFDAAGVVNPDFIRQLAAFQMLRDDFQLELADLAGPSVGTGADRTHILSLSKGPTAAKWSWAVERLIYHVEHHARRHHHAHHRGVEFLKLLADNLTPLSKLAGFDPPTKTWWQVPTHTLRFAEVLAKIYASRFGVGELVLVLTAEPHLDGDDPFPLSDDEEALDLPLELPDEDEGPALWKLRKELLEIHVSDEEAEAWTWTRIHSSLRDEFGYSPGATDELTSLGEHFFPKLLEQHGHSVPLAKRQYRVQLITTTAAMWNTPDSPFQYDSGNKGELTAEIPMRDEMVLNKLMRIRSLSPEERNAVRDLYYLPRLNLATFAFIFENFGEVAERLIEEHEERERWRFFRRQFALCHKRCRAIAHYLSAHVDRATGTHDEHGHVAWVILRSLFADENRAKTHWESNSGDVPHVTWGPIPNGSAFAALLGLTGTGLLGQYEVGGGPHPIWREMGGPMDAFGAVNNAWNVPVPMIIPALDTSLTAEQLRYEGVRNGIAIANRNAERLGGAQSFCVTWSGALLVDEAGSYRFWGGGPTPHHEKPDLEHVHNRRWRVSLRRGQRAWVLLSHHWEGEQSSAPSATLALKRGAYDLTIEFAQCPATPDDLEDSRPQRTGFQLKYEGPDTHDKLEAVPHWRLFTTAKKSPLDHGLDERTEGVAKKFLNTLYVSTLRDIRRTYQRAFKALLFARRFELSATVFHDYAQSELGYFLDEPDNFQGIAFFGAGWTQHLADFDFNFLPLLDNYHPPTHALDDRVAPSLHRVQALFDIWERVFDYVMLRRNTKRAPDRPAWLLFDEAAEKQPDDPAQLLRHLDIDLAHAPLVLTFYRGYHVVATDLMDERWAIRVWRADEWLERVIKAFLFKDLSVARPDLWASDDPVVVEAGETVSGNQNLTRVVRAGLIENGPPERYEDLKKLDDGLRERARCAMIAYLCRMNRVLLPDGTYATRAKHLTDLLLLDVEAGLCERASRIDEAITAVQTFVQRARLGLEPSFTPSPAFNFFWDRRFRTFRVWQACVRRTFYRENWIEWDELDDARKTEGFRFLESELRRVDLTMPVPGGREYWDGPRPLDHPGLKLLQSREPSTLKLITPPTLPVYDEALNLLGTPSRAARRSWLAPISVDQGGGNNTDRTATDSTFTRADVPGGPQGNAPKAKLPYWIEAAIRLGIRFVRVAAAGVPPASMPFAPRPTGTGCCRHCGCQHEPLVDEYYFWIVDSRWFDKLEGDTPDDPDSQDADTPGWHDANKLPTLLYMADKPMVHLYWARIHNGEIEAPRRSSEGVRLRDGVTPDQAQLEFAGRTLDSLRFRVQNGDKPPGYANSPEPGFRYDLATDDAVVLPEMAVPPALPPSPWGGLPAYPFFSFFNPGASLFPLTSFSESTTIASVLRAHCKFEAALRWYALTYDPLDSNDDWCPAKQDRPPDRVPSDVADPNMVRKRPAQPVERVEGAVVKKASKAAKAAKGASKKDASTVHADVAPPVDVIEQPPVEVIEQPPTAVEQPPPREILCCKDTAVPDEIARRRDITLDYLETLLQWGDCLMLHNNPEAFQQARLIFDTAARILGPMPRIIQEEDHTQPPITVGHFVAAHAALNPRLTSLYEHIDDRLGLIHSCNNGHRLRNGRLGRDMNYFGDDEAIDGWRTVKDVCDDDCECCCPTSPYRFVFVIEKAKELAAQTQQLGGALLVAFEKGDAEYLAYVRSEHEKRILELQLQMKQNALRDADWQVQALQKTKEIAQTNLNYNNGLISVGLISGETDYQDLTNGALGSRTAGTVLDSIAEVMNFIPDIHVGTVDFVDLPIGSKLSRVFETGARISNEVAEILSTTAGLRLTQAGWDRRLTEWQHQVDDLTIEIEQIERQILGAERRRDVALRDLNNHQQQIEQSRELLDLLRDKFTNHQLYLFLQKETAALYYQMYELALCCARQAQRAFNYERGHTARRFVPVDAWDNFRDGLLAGERLQLAVRRMETAYYDENTREYELTKYLSLALGFGRQFLELKRTGKCEIELPEWRFDLDYPGQYMRRIKNVSLTIPCVTGPYAGVHCRLTLLSSMTRIDPRLHGPVTPCCEEKEPKPTPRPPCDCFPMPRPLPEPKHYDLSRNGYVPLPDDPRIVKEYAAREAIATSTGQNDAGLFELNFRDERYLPFEFAGAVSRWRIELPQENNFFDVDTLSDVVMQLRYTAREGGDVLRRAASGIAQEHIPDDGLRMFDLQRDFANEWHRLEARIDEDQPHTRFELHLERRHFPFLPGHRAIWIKRLELFFEAEGAEPSMHHEIEFAVKHKHGCKFAEEDEHEFQCVGSLKWPELFHGAVDVQLGPLHGRHKLEGEFRFGRVLSRIRRAWLLCHYETRRG